MLELRITIIPDDIRSRALLVVRAVKKKIELSTEEV